MPTPIDDFEDASRMIQAGYVNSVLQAGDLTERQRLATLALHLRIFKLRIKMCEVCESKGKVPGHTALWPVHRMADGVVRALDVCAFAFDRIWNPTNRDWSYSLYATLMDVQAVSGLCETDIAELKTIDSILDDVLQDIRVARDQVAADQRFFKAEATAEDEKIRKAQLNARRDALMALQYAPPLPKDATYDSLTPGVLYRCGPKTPPATEV